MKLAMLWPAAFLLAGRVGAEPLSGELEDLLKDSRCSATAGAGPTISPAAPLTMQMPKAPLAKVFEVLSGLMARDCPVKFDVAPEVASMVVTVELRNVKLETALDVLAGNNNLVYVVDGGMIHVRPKPSANQPHVSLRLGLQPTAATREAPVRPTIVLLPGGCGRVMRSTGGDPAFRLHPESAALEKEANVSGVRIQLCLEKMTNAGLDLLGEAVVGQVFEDGYRSREERTIFRKAVGAGQKDIVLFKGPEAPFELKLLTWEVEGPAK
jgi:hypothetical protein